MIKAFFTKDENFRQRGAAMLIFIIFFLFASVALTYTLSNSILSEQKNQSVLIKSKQSYLTALSANEDILYRYVNGMVPDATESIQLAGASAVSTITVDGGTGKYHIVSDSDYLQAQRSSEMTLAVTSGISFNFGIQTGEGGFELANSAQVIGNVYSNGPIIGKNSSNVVGSIVSAGPAGKVDGLDATGDVYAHTITNIASSMTVGGHAYYQSITGGVNVTNGATYKHPGSPDQPLIPLPIDDDTILAWEAEALAGGTYLGCSSPTDTYTIDSDVIIGPLYIPCNLLIDKNNTDVTLTGSIWVKGNFNVKGSTVWVDSSLSGKVVPIIAHNGTSGGVVTLESGATFTSESGGFVMVVSMKTNSGSCGSDPAISLGNLSTGELILYAPHGILKLANNTQLTQGTAWKICAENPTTIIFDEGLINPEFTSGPAGTFTIDDWEETY